MSGILNMRWKIIDQIRWRKGRSGRRLSSLEIRRLRVRERWHLLGKAMVRCAGAKFFVELSAAKPNQILLRVSPVDMASTDARYFLISRDGLFGHISINNIMR